MLKKLFWALGALVIFIGGAYLFAVYQNNRDLPYPRHGQIQQQREKAIQWLVDHQRQILSQTNPMLWWMISEAQKSLPDERLTALLESYFRLNRGIRQSAWGPLFGERPRPYLGAFSVVAMPYYNQHFIYALNCAEGIAEDLSVVAAQNDAGFCHQANYIYRPACTTHQLMGIHFLSSGQCNLLADIDTVTWALQEDIVFQLSWDVRVVDVYLQRVLMLLVTGAQSSVKPVWLQQVLAHQLPDGGWGDFDPLIPLPGAGYLGYSSRILSIGQPASSFHATAQGVYILSWLQAAGASSGKTGITP